MFNQQELQILLGGVNAPVDLDDLRKHTNYGGLYDNEEPTIQAFWRVRLGTGREKKSVFSERTWIKITPFLPLSRSWRASTRSRGGRFCGLSRAAVDHRCCEWYRLCDSRCGSLTGDTQRIQAIESLLCNSGRRERRTPLAYVEHMCQPIEGEAQFGSPCLPRADRLHLCPASEVQE